MSSVSPPLIHVGCGIARDECSSAAGRRAAVDARAAIPASPLSAVLVFASAGYDLPELLRGIRSVTGAAPLLGATTAGEICNGLHHDSVVVTIIASPYLTVQYGVGTGVAAHWRSAVDQAVSTPELAPFFRINADPWHDLTRQGKSLFGMIFSPGTTRGAVSQSFEILEELKQRSLGKIPFFGGAAADDWHMERNHVLAGDSASPDSLLVALFETHLTCGIAIGHGFLPTSRQMQVTHSDGHELLELDGQPAPELLARVLGVDPARLADEHFTLSTGATLGGVDSYGRHSIIVASFITPRGGIWLTQPVVMGTTLQVMRMGPLLPHETGSETIRKAMVRGGVIRPALALTAYCGIRPRLLGDAAAEELAGMVEPLAGAPLTGFCSFGEQGVCDDGVTRHNNGIIATLVVGNDLSHGAQVARENELLRLALEQQADRLGRTNETLERRVTQRTAELTRNQDRATALLNLHLRTQEPLENLTRFALEEAVRFMESRYGFLATVSGNEKSFTLLSWSREVMTACAVTEPQVFPVHQSGLLGEAVLQRRPLIVNDYLAEYPGKKGYPAGHVLLTRFLCVPVLDQGRIVMLAAMANRDAPYTDEDARQLIYFMSGFWQVLQRKRFETGLQEEQALLARRVAERTADLTRANQLLVRENAERQLAEAALITKTEELSIANAALVKAGAAKNQFLATMSHELRTPLNAILGFAETLLERSQGPLTDQQERSLRVITESGRHLLSLINDILDLARIEAGHFPIDLEECSVAVLCGTSLQFVRKQAHQKRIDLTLNLDRAPQQLHTDHRRVKQILVNLLANAVKFTPPDGQVALIVEDDPHRDAVRFLVRDTGIGIPREELSLLFKPFVQLDSTLSRQYEGSGLGLALVARLTDLLGGSVAVASEPGTGSLFTITLPGRVGPVDSGHPSAAPPDGPPLLPSGMVPPVVLLAEDNEPCALMTAEYLRNAGCRVFVAGNGEEAVAGVQEHAPDLVIMDIQMPGLDGFEAIRQIRRLAQPAGATPIIALTALAMPGDRERCREAGADEYFSKPAHLRDLVRAACALANSPTPGRAEP